METAIRRNVLVGLAATALSCPACLLRAEPRGTANKIIIKGVLCASGSSAGFEIGETLKTSGKSDLDKNLVAELLKQSEFFGFRPAFILYQGGNGNAAATPEVHADHPGTDGTIFYHIGMLEAQLSASKWGGAVVAGVIAHEFAHIYQNFTNSLPRLMTMGPTVKFVELHADFLAGFYMGGKDRSIDVKSYANAFFEFGDYGFTSPDHHGTPAERFLALKAGYNFRRASERAKIADAVKEAEKVLFEYIH